MTPEQKENHLIGTRSTRPDLYVDDSQASQKVEQLFQEQGIEYNRMDFPCPFRIVPALITPEGRVHQGSACIRLYYLREGADSRRQEGK